MVREEFEVLYFLGLGNIRGQKVGEFQKGRRIGPHDIRAVTIRALGVRTEEAQPEEVFSSLFHLRPTHRQVPKMAGLILSFFEC